MAEITRYPLMRHFRAEPTAHVLRYRKGTIARSGPGLTFWFAPTSAAIAEVPLDDQDVPFVFHARSADFQDLAVQGVITFRFTDPSLVARRVDFTLDLASGNWTETPLEQVQSLLVQMSEQYVIHELLAQDLRQILAEGVAPIRDRIASGLAGEATLTELGLEIVAVRVAALAPDGDVQKALAQPTREAVQQRADEATFSRRALAVEKERAIAENELASEIELARRREELVAQQGTNDRRQAEEEAATKGIAARAAGERERLAAAQRAEALAGMENVRIDAERRRAEIEAGLGAQILLAVAARELAGQIGKVEHLSITPELLSPIIERLGRSGTEA